jgi:UDP-GlcNAc:undecaprenyl-phosphate GlcNAc-1-phosphate transferase
VLFDPASVLALSLGLAVALAATPLAAKIARKLKIVDKPNSSIKTHSRIVPYLGGIPIFLGAILPLALLAALGIILPSPSFLGLVVCGTSVLVAGLIDDIKTAEVSHRLFFQIGISILAAATGLRMELPFLHSFGLEGWPYYALTYFLSVFTFVGIINAFNIIDILDGFAAGVAVFAAVTLSIMSSLSGQGGLVVLGGLAVAGAALGFLRYNYHPAKIFMGDAGSTFLGFMLAGLGMLYTQGATNPVAVFTPLVVLAIPIFDTLYVMYLRRKKGMSPLAGSKDHFALRMIALGIDRRLTVDYIYAMAAALSVFAIVMQELEPIYFLLVFAAIALSFVGFGHALCVAVDVPVPVEYVEKNGGVSGDRC